MDMFSIFVLLLTDYDTGSPSLWFCILTNLCFEQLASKERPSSSILHVFVNAFLDVPAMECGPLLSHPQGQRSLLTITGIFFQVFGKVPWDYCLDSLAWQRVAVSLVVAVMNLKYFKKCQFIGAFPDFQTKVWFRPMGIGSKEGLRCENSCDR